MSRLLRLECPICHYLSRSNFPKSDDSVVSAMTTGPADNAATANIAARVAVNLSVVSRFFAQAQALPFPMKNKTYGADRSCFSFASYVPLS